MNGVFDTKGISEELLGHVFLGDIKRGKLQGYHHEGEDYGDQVAEVVTVDNGQITVRAIEENKGKGIYEATIRHRITHIKKSAYGGKSSFFNRNWSRQQVVDCIDRAVVNQKLDYPRKNIAFDSKEEIVIVKITQSAYPILKY